MNEYFNKRHKEIFDGTVSSENQVVRTKTASEFDLNPHEKKVTIVRFECPSPGMAKEYIGGESRSEKRAQKLRDEKLENWYKTHGGFDQRKCF